jgi:hypothetical protein
MSTCFLVNKTSIAHFDLLINRHDPPEIVLPPLFAASSQGSSLAGIRFVQAVAFFIVLNKLILWR